MSVFGDEESDMHPVVRGHLEEQYPAHYFYHEWKFGSRWADYVAASIDGRAARERIDEYKIEEPLPREILSSISFLEGTEPAPREELIEQLPARSHIPSEMCFRVLRDCNYLLKDSDCQYRLSRPPEVLETVLGFELKLDNWRKALKQAKLYREAFADQAVVVMDAQSRDRVEKHTQEFTHEGIGLIFADYNGIDVVVEPRNRSNYYTNRDSRYGLSERSFLKYYDEKGGISGIRKPVGGHGELTMGDVSDSIDDVRE